VTQTVPAPVGVSANLLVGRDLDAVREAVDACFALEAQVVAYQEAGGYDGPIDKRAEHRGYRKPLHARPRDGRGMDSSVLAVREDRPVHASGVALVRADWIGPKRGIRWPGRGIPWEVVDLEIDNRIYRTLVASIHGPTGRLRQNARAWKRYMRRLRRLRRRLAHTHGATHFLFMGDWNCPASARDALSVHALLVSRIPGARIVETGTPIDYAVTDLPLDGRKGPKNGSDHHSVRFTRKAPR
jgi:hypothetical protein